MLESLRLKSFTRFDNVEFKFARNLNVLVGENGTGKTHVLKVAYSALAVSANGEKQTGGGTPTKSYLQPEIANKLRGVFRPDEIGRLARRKAGRSRSEVECNFENPRQNMSFSLNSTSRREVVVEWTPSEWLREVPVYFPTRELLTIAPGFVTLFENAHIPFEETWRDTAALLQAPLLKGPRELRTRALMKPLEEAMGGKVDADDSGRFYLKSEIGKIEMHLVAEGMRKLAMLARLIATGSLLDKGYLFWDEPESNMNPKIVKDLARIILLLAQNGIQVFIATHSLFLLRELYILQETEFKELDSSYFGLHIQEGGEVQVQQGATMDDIGDIAALDEQLSQSDRYLETEEMLSQKAH